MLNQTNQLTYANTLQTIYGFDKSGSIQYHFNSQGFRGDDYTSRPDIVFLGGSISFGVGVNYNETYSYILSLKKNLKFWNLSYAQEYYDNELIYKTIQELHTHQITDIPIIVQWVSDLRNKSATKNLQELIDLTNSLYNKHIHLLIDGREDRNKITSSQFDLINPIWLDSVADNTHPGPKTHRGLADFLIKKLYDKKIFTIS
jgi:hypothetical protein